MAKISIIVPVYNAEKYLRECLDSLINQTFKDLEIICVNDGSTDNSLEILEEYRLKDNRIKVFSQKNKGVSSARNLALENADGEYLIFVDSDDWIELNACEILYNTAKERKTDILLCSYFYSNNKSLNQDKRLMSFIREFGTNAVSFENSYQEIFKTPMGILCKFYKKELIIDNNINFQENIKCGEDRIFYIEACLKAKKISAIDIPLYFYRLDTQISLSKNPIDSLPHVFQSNLIIKTLLKSYGKDIYYKEFLETSFVESIIYYWNAFHNHLSKKQNLKYLLLLKKEFKTFSAKEKKISKAYSILSKEIYDYKNLFIKKLFEPIFEIELRRDRFVLYLLERQVLNFSTRSISLQKFKLKYLYQLLRLKIISKKRPIRVGFWMSEYQKWSSFESIYKALKENKNFEPFILLSCFKRLKNSSSIEQILKENIAFLEKNNIKYEKTYDLTKKMFLSLREFKPDIVFYQQPWQIPDEQCIKETSNFALTCYVPYCYYSLDSYINYLYGFHGNIWKYFVETEMHKKEYIHKYKAKNCVALGSTKLDKYKNLGNFNLWKTNKKRVIYAPHHTFNQEYNYQTATFKENGKFILDYAKSHPEFEWVLRPHPSFREKVLQNNIMTEIELEKYYKDWENLGTIYTGANYYELFNDSDCLITDCISFLTEYLPTQKPVIHLRKDSQNIEFNSLLKTVIKNYYQVYDNKYLKDIFEEVLEKNNDYLKEKRINSIKNLMIDEKLSVGQKITNYLMQQLSIKGNK